MPPNNDSHLADLIASTLQRPDLASADADWQAAANRVIADARQLQAIPAPTFEEAERARAVEARFQALGLADVSIDDLHNVYGRTPGADPSRPALLVSAHLDTVFPSNVNLATRDDLDNPPAERRIYGPGLGDNSLGLAGMIGLARELRDRAISLPADIWWVATVGEEGLGDLRGIRRACERLRDRLGVAIIIEGMGLSHVYHAGLGVRRLRVDINAPGGHSWLHSERPSAIHHLMQIGARLVERVKPSRQPKSSFNIGVVSGGTSINTRAPSASLSIDLRSVDGDSLRDLERAVNATIEEFPCPPEITVTVTIIGDRPSATLSPGHPLAQAGLATLVASNGQQPDLDIGSTDANVPLALGIPTVCIGLTTGGDAHTLGEYIHPAPLPIGLRRALILTILAAENTPDWKRWQ